MTRAELTAAVTSLHNVGGLYEFVALYVWADNKDRCEENE